MPPTGQRKSTSLVGRFDRSLQWLLVKLRVEEVPHIKRIIVTVVGGTVLILGVVLLLTPGPATLVIPLGLAILGTEYAWARRWLRKARKMAQQAITKTQEIIRPNSSANDEKPAERTSSETPTAAGANRNDERELVGAGASGEEPGPSGHR